LEGEDRQNIKRLMKLLQSEKETIMGKRKSYLLVFILVIILSFGPIFLPHHAGSVSAQTAPVELAPSIGEQSTLGTSTSNPFVFFTRTVNYTYNSGAIYLSSQPNTPSQTGFDDALRITVTHQDGSIAVFYHEYRTLGVNVFDFAPWLEVGTNTLYVELIDQIYGSRGGTALYLTPLQNVPLSLPPSLAWNKPASASSTERVDRNATQAVDGNMQTRWSSVQRVDPQWIAVDLRQIYNIRQVVLEWEAYAESYRIEFSNDGSSWTTAAVQEAMNGGRDVIPVLGSARYVRVYGLTRGISGFGYSLFEFAVYDFPVFPVPQPQVRPPAAVPDSNTLFFDDFEDGANPAWNFSGTHSVTNGVLELTASCSSSGFSSALVGDSSWTDYEVQFDFRGVGGSVKQFQFRYADPSSAGRYVWQARSLENDIGLSGAGRAESLLTFQIQQGTWYRVRIRVEGEHIQIYVDGQLVLDKTDSGTQRLSGGVGPFLQSGTVNCPFRVQYDNVMVNLLSLGDRAAALARKVVGANYVLGAKGWDRETVIVSPEQIKTTGYEYWNASLSRLERGTSLDCSGLVVWAYGAALGSTGTLKEFLDGNPIGYQNADGLFRHNTIPINDGDLKPGDLLFVDTPAVANIDHVAMYVGNDQVVEATPTHVILRTKSEFLSVYESTFAGYGRVVKAKKGIRFEANSPIGLIVTDPDGLTITPDTLLITEREYLREIPGALYYSHSRFDESGFMDDVVTAPVLKTGVYLIKVVPKPGASPSDTYGLTVEVGGQIITLTENVPISNIPSQGYKILSDGNTVVQIVNTPPIANDDTASTNEDTAVTIPVTANDTDADGNLDLASVSITLAPMHGAAFANGDGSVSYTPHLNFNGSDSFTYQVCDTESACATALVTITVTPVNDAPVANDDAASTNEDISVTIPVTFNDTDADGNLVPASVSITGVPTNGAAFANGDGTVTYTPQSNFNGSDSFTYQVCDTLGACDIAVVTITVNAVNDAPMVGATLAAVAIDEGQTASNGGSVSDVDGDGVTLTAIPFGIVTNNGDGTWSWVFATSNGPDQTATVTIFADDGHGGSSQTTFNLTVNNVAPTVNAGADASIVSGSAFTVNAVFSDPGIVDTHKATIDFGAGAGPQSALVAQGAGSGTVSGSQTYFVPGTYTITVCVADDDSGSGCDSLVVTVVNQPPVCASAGPSVASLSPPNHNLVSVNVIGVTDPESDPVVITITSIFQDEPVNGTGDGDTSPDGQGIGTPTAMVRAEAAGSGNGRVYHISFTANDSRGGVCSGKVLVSVPKSQGKNGAAVDDGALYDSTLP
jgi:cell wall-associated NlpC family hydrolase